MVSKIVEIGCISHCYPDQTQVHICGMDFTMYAGEKVALLGSNGSGKTTLLAHVTGLLTPTSGQVKVFGMNPRKEFKKIRHRLGVVLQSPSEQLVGPTVWDDVAFSLKNAGWPDKEVDKRVEEVLTELNIMKLAHKIPHYLSGGEQQRVALAGALAMLPELLVLDEPFSKLDLKGKKELINLLNKINQKYNTAIIFSVHELSYLPQLADQVYLMKSGEILAKGRPEEVVMSLKLLEEAGLEPPPQLELIKLLNQKGIDIPNTLNIHELTDYLANLCRIS